MKYNIKSSLDKTKVEQKSSRVKLHNSFPILKRFITIELLSLILILLSSCIPSKTVRTSNRDNLYLKSGEEFAGKVMEWKGDTLLFRAQDTLLYIHKSLISSLEFTKKREGDWWRTEKDIDDPTLKNGLKQKPEEWYKNGGYITLLSKKEFFINDDGTVTAAKRIVNKVLKERGKSVANQRFTYLSSTSTAKLLFARGITEKGNIVSIKENAIEDAPYFRNFLLYDDFRQKKFAIPEARMGSLLDYSYCITNRCESRKPFFEDINIGGWEPLKLDSIIVNLTENKKILYRTDGLPEPTIKKTKNSTRYIWVTKNIKGRKKENLSPPPKDIFPRLTIGESMTWEEVDALLTSSLRDSLIYPEEILKRLANIKTGQDSIIVDSLYALVCKEIRFAPIPINATIPVPKSLKTIYKTKYANSLDKTYFLYGLLDKCGIESYIILARAKTSGKLVKEVPSPTQFSYAILSVVINGDTILLDPRDDTYTEEYISEKVQGTEGLVLGKSGKFITIPLLEKEGKKVEMRVNIEPDGSCEIAKKEYLYGSLGINMRNLKEMKEEEVRKMIEEYIASVSPSAELIDYSLSPLTNLMQPVSISVHYRIKNFAFVAGDFLFVALPEIDYSAGSVGATERELPLFFKKYQDIEHTITFFIPEEFDVYHIGKEREYKENFISFSAKFSSSKNRVVYKDIFRRNISILEPKKYKQYRTCLQLMGEVSDEMLVLKKR